MIPAQNTVPYTQTPLVTWAIFGICTAAFIYQSFLPQSATEDFLKQYAMVPRRYSDGAWAAQQGLDRFNLMPFGTSMFLHAGVLHLVFNLWTLWVFGPALEERLGAGRFAALYLLSGLAAGLLHFAFNLSSAVPALGASGAIAGIIAAYARRFPYAWVNVLQPIVIVPVLIPAVLFAGLWFLAQVWQATGSLAAPGDGGGVAWWAHIGGFAAGWWLVGRLAPSRNAADEMTIAVRSGLWPWETLNKWTAWWWRRR
jgi:membrane associated rhomboid family serine protease